MYLYIYIYIELCLYFYINILVRILTCRHQYNKQIRTCNINIGNVNMKHSNPNIEQNESTDFMPVRAALPKPNMSEKWVKRFYANLSKTSSPNPMKKAHFPRNWLIAQALPHCRRLYLICSMSLAKVYLLRLLCLLRYHSVTSLAGWGCFRSGSCHGLTVILQCLPWPLCTAVVQCLGMWSIPRWARAASKSATMSPRVDMCY